MKVVRLAAAVVVVALSLSALWFTVWLPYRCHRLKDELSSRSYGAFAKRDDAARRFAEKSIPRLEECMGPTCRDLTVMFLLAINHRTLRRPEVALSIYRDAVEVNERPEVYLNLADTQAALGQHDEAFANYVQAVTFFPGYLHLIDDRGLRARVRAEVLRLHPDLQTAVERAETRRALARWLF